MSALTLPPAPARLSTMTGWPSDSASLPPTTRAIVSLGPPGRKPTTKRIGRVGYLSSAPAAGIAAAAAITAAPNACFIVFSRVLFKHDPRDFHELCPACGILLYQLREVGPTLLLSLHALRSEAVSDFATADRALSLVVQLLDDRKRRFRRHHEPVPDRHVIAFQRLADRRNIGRGG